MLPSFFEHLVLVNGDLEIDVYFRPQVSPLFRWEEFFRPFLQFVAIRMYLVMVGTIGVEGVTMPLVSPTFPWALATVNNMFCTGIVDPDPVPVGRTINRTKTPSTYTPTHRNTMIDALW